MWKDSPDFVRMATRCRAIIVPFAAVGGDDAYDIALDTDEILSHPVLGPLARHVLRSYAPRLSPEDVVVPISKVPGLGVPSAVPLPRIERLYFRYSRACALGYVSSSRGFIR